MNMYLRLLVLWLRTRVGRRISLWSTARTPFRVNLADLDLLMHMNNGRYLSLLDLGRMDLMIRSGFWSVIQEQGWYPVVAGQTISYRRPLNPFQRFELRTRVLGIDEKWVYMEQTFVSRGEVAAHAVVRARFLKKAGGSVTSAELLELTGPVPADRTALPAWVVTWSEEAAASLRRAASTTG
ncbi:MAG: acyl-CoA thioesterase [Brachybacterium sp.]|nr:acyl-CoA thioesterase [Brachybacterium sp.]